MVAFFQGQRQGQGKGKEQKRVAEIEQQIRTLEVEYAKHIKQSSSSFLMSFFMESPIYSGSHCSQIDAASFNARMNTLAEINGLKIELAKLQNNTPTKDDSNLSKSVNK